MARLTRPLHVPYSFGLPYSYTIPSGTRPTSNCKANKSIHLCIRALEAALMYCTIAMVKQPMVKQPLNEQPSTEVWRNRKGSISKLIFGRKIRYISVMDFQKYSLMIFSILNYKDYCQLSLFL